MFSARIPPVVWAGIVALVALAVPTWKFGRQFLLQFFIVPLWLHAYVSNRTGVMPMQSGPPLRRAVMFAFNLWISWQVMSRRP